MRLDLLRTQQKGPTGTADGTFGAFTLYHDDGTVALQCCCLEDDWLNNATGKSCIPAGDYALIRHTMSHWTPLPLATWMVEHVENRSGICIHPARTEEQVEGCVGIASAFMMRKVDKDEDTGALNVMKQGLSTDGAEVHARFMALTKDETRIPFTVRWAPGLPA